MNSETENQKNKNRIGSSKSLCIFFLAFIFLLAPACMNYFKVKHPDPPYEQDVLGYRSQYKNIIIHHEPEAWVVGIDRITDDTIRGYLTEEYVRRYERPIRQKGANRYRTNKKHDESYLLNEVHIYTSSMEKTDRSGFQIPITAIQRIDVYDKDNLATTGSYFLGGVGITAGAMAVLTVIIALTKESCPFIYTLDGDHYSLTGEIYSGSVQPALERNDYLKLPNEQNPLAYELRISNEVKEIQHTNLMELYLFDHSADKEVYVDKYGIYHTVGELITAEKALTFRGEAVNHLVGAKDSLFYFSSEIDGDLPLTDGLILEFPNKHTNEYAKLVVRAKNSFMLDYMMGQFQDLMGNAYGKVMKKQRQKSREELMQWSLDQNIPLMVSVERNGEWQDVDYFNVAGPMAMKEDVLKIPLDGTESDPLRIKLEAGNFFWEIDYVGIDYSEDEVLNCQHIHAQSALNQDGKEIRAVLLNDDRKYYNQEEIGDYADLIFELPPLEQDQRTVYLHSKGWYQILRSPTGIPDRDYLLAFRQPGRFNQFVNEYIQSVAKN